VDNLLSTKLSINSKNVGYYPGKVDAEVFLLLTIQTVFLLDVCARHQPVYLALTIKADCL
jgi:hypothetical protein